VNSTNGLLGELRVAQLSQKPDFACASRTQNRAIEFTLNSTNTQRSAARGTSLRHFNRAPRD
jgi:hypothetical protein